MDWFLYDNGLRHETVKNTFGRRLLRLIIFMERAVICFPV